MREIMDWMLSEKIAKNDFNASAIVNGLKLWELDNDEDKKARVRLYRDWRNAGEKTKIAFEHAIRGDKILASAPMFEGAMLSE